MHDQAAVRAMLYWDSSKQMPNEYLSFYYVYMLESIYF